ncbi:MAG: bifunctional demethylmenaquinone methyltransferase/2-methoxy-6-polyprenyl-1,4-benzoquinol methylase UbiE [Actinobacteria bacterium]|nr:bifunctional demethylmenaquinone methyltransferase/2-methoxy-6-polyprenyl-1,4-benzoquinol methylase UbiE [Actinomycetota bacterium]
MDSLPSKENKAKYVQETFNSIAKNYDLMNTLMSLGLDKSWRRLTVKRSELKEGGKGLDVCCGTGMLTMEQARVAGSAGKITGLDFSENMLDVAWQNIRDFEFKDSIQFVQGDAMDLPFENNKFDCATVGWGLRNVPDILKAVREMVRVVKPGGKVISLDMAQPMTPVFREFYWLCFNKVVPAMGKLLSGNKKAYGYLHDSAKVFVHQKELAGIFAKAGLVETRYLNLCGGVVAIVEGRKP